MTITVRRRQVIGAFAIGAPRACGLIVTLAPRGSRADPMRREYGARLASPNTVRPLSVNTIRPANIGGARGRK